MRKPLIGVTLDYQTERTYSKFPWYALRKNYVDSLADLECLVWPLPYGNQLIDGYVERLDGVVISGGFFDVDPKLFGEDVQHSLVKLQKNRTVFELALIQAVLPKKIPLLGICGGQQILNVALGGTLIQHIPDEIENALQHEQQNPRNEAGHVVDIKKGTYLADVVEHKLQIPVNSAHHQAVKDLGVGLRVNALASDGVIEGIELIDHPFCIGVQWHPEFLISEADHKLFKAFIKAAAQYSLKGGSGEV